MIKFVIKNYSQLIKIRKFSRLISTFFTFNVNYLNENENKQYFDEVMLFHKNSNNTFKHTSKNRFEDIDKISLEFIKKNDAIHDIAVSSGITSLELMKKLNNQNIDVDFNISDKYSKINSCGNNIVKVYNKDNEFEFGYFFNIYCCKYGRCNKLFFLSSILYKILEYINCKNCKEIMLYNPEVIGYISQNKITDLDYDIFEINYEDKFNFIRCMNILNRLYFNDNQLKEALNNIIISLKDKGYLLVGRTLNNVQSLNIASIYQKNGIKLIHIKDINNGSDIKDILNLWI